MPFCPECREEFRPEIEICKGCGVELVNSLEEEEDQIADLAVICSISQEDKAYILRGFLESEGIPCQLENVTFHSAPGGDLTKVRLWAKQEDVEKARRIIEEHEQGTTCSACGHVVLGNDEVCDFCGEKFEPV